MKRVVTFPAVILSTFLLTGSPWAVVGQEAGPSSDANEASQGAKADSGPKPSTAPTERPAFAKLEDVAKGMESQKGLFTLWSYPASAKDKDTEKLLCQIPRSFLGQKFMLSQSYSGGGFYTGFPLEEHVVQWEMLDRQLVLVEPETSFVVDAKHTVSDVVRRTYPDRIRVAVPILAKSSGGDPVIDLGRMLKSNFASVPGFGYHVPRGGSRGGVSINASLSKWTKKKAFELNVELGVELAVAERSKPGAYSKAMVHYSFWKLPKSTYKPRIADDRVGYFITANQDWAKPTDTRDIFNRYIDRWHLEKRDTSLAMCEPKQPIIFYIEKTVPVRFRQAVRDGILEWNRAFEKIGFVAAIQVRQQTDDNEWKDLDPEDMRYSFFRWIVSGRAFAMGPHRSNPFTGQIYDADIIFDDSMVRVYDQRAERSLPAALAARKLSSPVLRDFVKQHPQWLRPERDWEDFRVEDETIARVRVETRTRMRQRRHRWCDYAEGMQQQLYLGQAILADRPKDVKEKFLYDIIREIVMHEVGHTLGLRHNFKASSIYSLAEIKKRKQAGQATVGSVMDYNPALFFAEGTFEGDFVTPTVGSYDYWAIEYGYRPADGKYKASKGGDDKGGDDKGEKDKKSGADSKAEETKEEKDKDKETKKHKSVKPPKGVDAAEFKMLQAIASRGAEPELAYATDEDTTGLGPDPRANRFDMGSDPIEWANERFKLIDQRLASILEWSVKDGESWYHIRGTFRSLLYEKASVVTYVGRYIGGQHTSRAHRGDPGAPAPFELVDPAKQHEAMSFIEETLFTDAFFGFSPEVLNHLATSRWWHDRSDINYTVDFPIHDWIASMQWSVLFDLLFPNMLRRMHDAQMKAEPGESLTVSAYLGRIQAGCWKNALDAKRAKGGTWSETSPFVSDIRRSLQREYLNLIEPMVRSQPGMVLSPDLHAMVQHSVRRLLKKIDGVLAMGQLDFPSEAHLVSCQSRIKRMLAPPLEEHSGFLLRF